MGILHVVMMRMLCLRASLQSEDNICGGDVDRPSGIVVDNKSKNDESIYIQGDVMLVGDGMVHMLV